MSMPTSSNEVRADAAAKRGNWLWSLPYLAIGLFAIAMLALVWGLQARETELQTNALARDVQWAEQTMRLHFQNNQEFAAQLARELVDGSLDAAGFQIRASQHLANNPALTSISRIDAEGITRWAAPFETTERIAGEALPAGPAAAFASARSSGRPSFGEAYTNRSGIAAVDLIVPAQRGREPLGAIVATYAVDGILRHLAPNWFGDKYRLRITTAGGALLAANSAVGAGADDLRYAIPLAPPGGDLILHASAYRADSGLPRLITAILIVGLTLVVSGSLWTLRTHVLRRVQVEKERDQLFNLSLDMLAIASIDGSFRRLNPAFEKVLGYPRAALAGKSLLDFVHADDIGATVEALRQLARGQPASFENRWRCADGRDKWLVWSINPVPEEKLLYAVAHDITDRKRAEEALRAEYAFRKAMEESVNTGLRAIDLSGRIIYVNPAFCQMVGWAAEELVGAQAPFPYWPPEDRDELQRHLDETLRGGSPVGGYEMRIQRRDGERFHVRIYVSPLVDSDGRQSGWMASMNDITEPKRARAELEAAHERFVAVLDGLDSAVHVADVESDGILYANRAFGAIFGTDAVGRNCWQVTARCLPGPTALLHDPRQLAPAELPRELYDGEVQNALSGRWYHWRDRAIKWVDGRVVRMVIATDISERKQFTDENIRQQARFEQTSRLISMGEMASSLAHELNQPLSAIANYCMGCVDRLQTTTFKREEVLDGMNKAAFQAERAGKIIRRMREFVRKSEPNRASVPLAAIVEEAIGFAEIEAGKARVRISIDIPADLPPVFADRIMIEQVVLNLVKNGIEAMQQTTPECRQLTVSAHVNGGRAIELAVADRGQGVNAEQIERLFQPFYTTKAQGMGMGLNICRSIVEFHKGRLWASPNPEGGSIFRFTLPMEN